jgi:hypothetical protein
MRSIILAIGVLAAGVSSAATLPEGAYAGTANWRGPGGSTGTYSVERSFSGNTMTAHYSWAQPQPREETLSVTFETKGQNPMFDVLDDKKQVVGTGYCADDTCAYHATFGPVVIDETLRWCDGSVVVTGAKSGPGFSVVWKETLKSR